MTITDRTVDVAALIREEAALGTPRGEIAEAVAERLPEEWLREIVAQLLSRYVNDLLGAESENASPTKLTPFPQAAFSHAAPPVAPVRATYLPVVQPFVPHSPAAPRPLPARANGHRPAVGNRKRAEIRQAWQRALDVTYSTPTGSKHLGDCTADDLFYIAQEHTSQADRLRRMAAGWRELATVMNERGAYRLRDLPEDLLRTSLGAK